MQRIITYTISPEDSGISILSFLRNNGFSKHILTTMKRADHAILLNGQPSFAKTALKKQDVLRILVPEEAGSEESILPVKIPLNILYEDEDILVLNKPADMPYILLPEITRTLWPTESPGTTDSREKRLYTAVSTGWSRDTTGVLVLAKNPLSGALLSTQMKQRRIRRTYLALTDGIPPEKGTVRAQLQG